MAELDSRFFGLVMNYIFQSILVGQKNMATCKAQILYLPPHHGLILEDCFQNYSRTLSCQYTNENRTSVIWNAFWNAFGITVRNIAHIFNTLIYAESPTSIPIISDLPYYALPVPTLMLPRWLQIFIFLIVYILLKHLCTYTILN